MNNCDPLIEFFRAVPDSPLPTRADPTALGTLPIAAYRYCSAVTEASRFGWYVFSPLDIEVTWDGQEAIWSLTGSSEWHQLTSIQHPNFQRVWDQVCPPELGGLSPPFFSLTHHPGIAQLWTGLFVRTAANWSVLVRAPANVPAASGYQLYEGLIETDQWFGPLFINLRLTKTDYPIRFSKESPLFQVQLLPREVYSAEVLNRASKVGAISDWTANEWRDFEKVMARKQQAGGSIGGYSTHVRKRGKEQT